VARQVKIAHREKLGFGREPLPIRAKDQPSLVLCFNESFEYTVIIELTNKLLSQV